MQLAMLHKTVCREEEKTLVCTIMNMAQVPTLSVNWIFNEGVMERYTHIYPAALNDDDVGFRTDQRSEYIHKAYTGTFMISELQTHSYILQMYVYDGRRITTLTEAS